jgi:hypothetical protein
VTKATNAGGGAVVADDGKAAAADTSGTTTTSIEPTSYAGEDTYELVVCHGNVIRYCLL